MRDAVDVYAEGQAKGEGWTYSDRINGRGDYRHAYFTLVFVTEYPVKVDGRPAGTIPWTWKVEARAARCGPGWYLVSTPGDLNPCPPPRSRPAIGGTEW